MVNNKINESVKSVFNEHFVPELKKRGFISKRSVCVRKVGSILQVVGADSGCIRAVALPFWINDDTKTSNYIDYSKKSAACLAHCGSFNFPLEIAPLFYSPQTLEYFQERILNHLDEVCDEESFAKYCQTINEPFLVNDYVLLFICYRHGSLQFAKNYIEEAFEKVHKKDTENARMTINNCTQDVKDGRVFIFEEHPDREEQLKLILEEDKIPLEQALYDTIMRGEQEQWIVEKATEYTARAKKVQFLLVQKVLEEKDFDYSNILKFRKENGARMNNIIKNAFDLDFENELND